MDNEIQVEEKEEMVATLQAKKEALELKILEKNKELKLLCIQEAELTGILPPETPLEPGETPPLFRRRMGTAFTYPENLINNNNPKSKEESVLAALELECKVQRSIAEAALGISNDNMASKTVRRKHRLMYEQSRRRLMELESKLNNLRQSYHKNQCKQRKKPRPTKDLEGDAVEYDTNDIIHNIGVNLSPIAHQEDHTINGGYLITNDPFDAKSYLQYSTNDYTPLQERSFPSTHSHYQESRPANFVRHGGEIYFSRPDINTNAETTQNFYPSNPDFDNCNKLDDVHKQQFDTPQMKNVWNGSTSTDSKKQYTVMQRIDANNAFGNQIVRPIYRFSSLEYRKIPSSPVNNSYPQLNVYGVSTSDNQGIITDVTDGQRFIDGGGALLPNQTYPETNLYLDLQNHVHFDDHENVSPSYSHQLNHALIRSDHGLLQGDNVEYFANKSGESGHFCDRKEMKHWNKESKRLLSIDPKSRISRELPLDKLCISDIVKREENNLSISSMPRSNSFSGSEKTSRICGDDTLRRKHKEKEWHETFLDTTVAPVHNNFTVGNSRVSVSPMSEVVVDMPRDFTTQNNTSDRPVIDIPVIETSKNHTVIQVGQWKPYREETKPFEMSDFYKYSTKFRKNQTVLMKQQQQNQQQQEQQQKRKQQCQYDQQHQLPVSLPQSPVQGGNCEQGEIVCNGVTTFQENDAVLIPGWRNRGVQKESCHQTATYGSRNMSHHSHNPLSSEIFLENPRTDPNFPHTITWHQDENVPCSATLV